MLKIHFGKANPYRTSGGGAAYLTYEFVTSAMNGEDKTRLFGIRFQLLPQVNDVRIDGARVGIAFVTPNFIEQTIATQSFRGMRNKVGD